MIEKTENLTKISLPFKHRIFSKSLRKFKKIFAKSLNSRISMGDCSKTPPDSESDLCKHFTFNLQLSIYH